MKILFYWLLLLPAGLLAQTGKDSVESFKPVVSHPHIPLSYTLFGEKVPLEIQDVYERFDREMLVNSYLQGGNLYILKLATRWLPMISDKLKAQNIPEDFKYLCVAESALQNQVSKAGATGFWQFMRSSGPGFGLEINNYVDERYHPEKSTEAAIRYLKMAYDKFGNWTAAAASYNCGMGGYNSRAMEQGTFIYYDLFLPEETMRYIFRIMALKYILENPEASGFKLDDQYAYLPYAVKDSLVNYSIPSLMKFAKDNGTNYKTLKLLNPWLRGNMLPNKKAKLYKIALPSPETTAK